MAAHTRNQQKLSAMGGCMLIYTHHEYYTHPPQKGISKYSLIVRNGIHNHTSHVQQEGHEPIAGQIQEFLQGCGVQDSEL